MLWELALNYEGFRALWDEALDEAGVGPYLFPATETLDLSGMNRSYEVLFFLDTAQRIHPFTVSAIRT